MLLFFMHLRALDALRQAVATYKREFLALAFAADVVTVLSLCVAFEASPQPYMRPADALSVAFGSEQ
jgi:hypothetical protein